MKNNVVLHKGDSYAILAELPENSVDAIVTDPPYGLGFMSKAWDQPNNIAFNSDFWREALRVLKPGGHMVAFSATRTYHRMVVAIEDAGFDIRDQLAWVYGTGFPKSLDLSKAIDKANGHWRGRAGPIDEKTIGQVAKGYEYERTEKGEPITEDAVRWSGWGTALKPAWEPICLARKPLIGTNVANVLTYGTGALNIDGCRVDNGGLARKICGDKGRNGSQSIGGFGGFDGYETTAGRFPANILHDGSDEVLAAFPSPHGAGKARAEPGGGSYDGSTGIGFAKNGSGIGVGLKGFRFGDSGSAARFFYCAKASKADRAGSKHPTVKPIALMRWLCRLITPPGGTILDPFTGSGTTAQAACDEGFDSVLIERETEYQDFIEKRFGLDGFDPIVD